MALTVRRGEACLAPLSATSLWPEGRRMRRPYEESQRCVCLSQHGFCSTIEELRNTRQHDASARLSFNAHTRKNNEEAYHVER